MMMETILSKETITIYNIRNQLKADKSASFNVHRELKIPKGEKIKIRRADVCAYNDS